MILRLFAFAFFVMGLATLAGDAWLAHTSAHPFVLRSTEAWWTATSPATLDLAQRQLPAIGALLPFPALAVLGVLCALMLLPTMFFRGR